MRNLGGVQRTRQGTWPQNSSRTDSERQKCPHMTPLEIKFFDRLGFWKTPNLRLSMASKRDICLTASTRVHVHVALELTGLQPSPLSSETTVSQGKPCLHIYLLEVERSRQGNGVCFFNLSKFSIYWRLEKSVFFRNYPEVESHIIPTSQKKSRLQTARKDNRSMTRGRKCNASLSSASLFSALSAPATSLCPLSQGTCICTHVPRSERPCEGSPLKIWRQLPFKSVHRC